MDINTVELLEIFSNIGLPSAIVGGVIIALIFRQSHPKISTASVIGSIFLIFTLGLVQLFAELSEQHVSIQLSPQQAYAFTADGRPTTLDISVNRNGKVAAHRVLQSFPVEELNQRTLSISSATEDFAVKYQGNTLGILSQDALRKLNWEPQNNAGSDPRFWYTNRVFVGQTLTLGNSKYGILKIRTYRFNAEGEAEVSLVLEGYANPIPKRIRVKNKQLAVQTFAGLPEFYIAVREADFKAEEPWAAFNIFSIQ